MTKKGGGISHFVRNDIKEQGISQSLRSFEMTEKRREFLRLTAIEWQEE